jgi:hypothetical protein
MVNVTRAFKRGSQRKGLKRMVRHRILLAVLALAICTGTAQANKLALTPSASPNLTCNTTTGAGVGTETITVKGAATGGPTYPVVVTASVPTGFTVTLTTPATGAAVLTTAASSVVFTVAPTNTCLGGPFSYTAVAGVLTASGASGNNGTITFSYQSWNTTTQTGTGSISPDATQAVNITETTPSVSPLTASVSPVIVSCKLSNGVYTPQSTSFNLTTAAVAGSTATFVTPNTTLTATGSPYTVNFGSSTAVTLTPTQAECTGKLGSTQTTFAQFTTASPAPNTVMLTLPVTVVIVGPQQLTITPGPGAGDVKADAVPLTYVKLSENMQTGQASLTAASNLLFTVDPTSVPAWLTVSPASQSVSSGSSATLSFVTTKVADSLTPGSTTYAQVLLNVAGYANTTVWVSLTVQNQAPVLTVQGGNTLNAQWVLNTPLPSPTITLLSNGATIPYSTSFLGSNPAGVSVSPAIGAVFSIGTQLTVNFSSTALSDVTPGTTLTTTLVITWNNGTTTVTTDVPINLVVNAAASSAATVSGITPSTLSPGVAGEIFTVYLYGSGFVTGATPTFVGVVTSGTTIANDTNISANVFNSSTIILTITQPATDTLVNWTKANNQIYLGVCNPPTAVGTCTTATGTIPLIVDSGPVISSGGVTSASTFISANQTTQGLAPYDMISIFGNNFCVSNGTGCLNNQVLYPTITTGTTSAPAQFATSITPDTTLAPASQRLLQVFFCPTANTTATTTLQSNCSLAPLLFATNNQINAMVPGGLTTTPPTKYDIVVRFGLTATTLSGVVLPPYTIITQAYDPGVFTVDPTNDGAIVLATGINIGNVTNSSSTPARVRPSPGVSDTVEIYMTGLGVPPGIYATPGTASTAGAPADCLTIAAYEGAWSTALTSLDGVVMQLPGPTFASGVGVPCWNPAAGSLDPSVVPLGAAFGATYSTTYAPIPVVSATNITYLGWAPGSIAGLYQANVILPALGATAATEIADASGNAVSKAAAAIRQVPVTLTMYPGSGVVTPITFPAVNMYVQPAMAFVDTTNGNAQGSSYITPSITTLGASLPWVLDTVTATGQVAAHPSYQVTADSLEASCPCSDFTIDNNSAHGTFGQITFATGVTPQSGTTYWVTITATDAGVGGRQMPSETITLYITPTS